MKIHNKIHNNLFTVVCERGRLVFTLRRLFMASNLLQRPSNTFEASEQTIDAQENLVITMNIETLRI